MRAVVDTNVVVSGLLWGGPARQILDRAHLGTIDLFTSPLLLSELEEVLSRGKFATRLKLVGSDPRNLFLTYSALAYLVFPHRITPVIERDPDDDAVLACAITAQAEVIISGDRHLLDLGEFQGIRIVKAAEFLALGGDVERSHRPPA